MGKEKFKPGAQVRANDTCGSDYVYRVHHSFSNDEKLVYVVWSEDGEYFDVFLEESLEEHVPEDLQRAMNLHAKSVVALNKVAGALNSEKEWEDLSLNQQRYYIELADEIHKSGIS